jgi:enoyl-CoA hydratase/carnithine racemase
MELFARLYDELTAFPKPTVAACHGAVVGGGAEIAVACDLRVGGSNLRMRFPGAELGVPVGPARLVTLCGLATAKYLLLTSRNVSADEALRMGLVHRVAPAAATEEAALGLAAEVAAHPPEAVARLKAMLLRWDGVVERSADEGRGQVEWQRSGPGLPYRT